MTGPILGLLERYYDEAPRPTATTEEVGAFTLFVPTDPDGWPYYARPRLGLDCDVTVADVLQVREHQRELGVPESFEWVHETTPSLIGAAREAGLRVEECPLLVLDSLTTRAPTRSTARHRVEVVDADDAVLGLVVGAINAGFHGSDTVEPGRVGAQPRLIAAGLLTMVAAYDETGEVVGGGSHGPRGSTTELTGIAVVPRARRRGIGHAITQALVADARAGGVDTIFLSAQDAAVARVYQRVGFTRVGTACIAGVP